MIDTCAPSRPPLVRSILSLLVFTVLVHLGYQVRIGLSPQDVGPFETILAKAVAGQIEHGPGAFYGPFEGSQHSVLMHAPFYYRLVGLVGLAVREGRVRKPQHRAVRGPGHLVPRDNAHAGGRLRTGPARWFRPPGRLAGGGDAGHLPDPGKPGGHAPPRRPRCRARLGRNLADPRRDPSRREPKLPRDVWPSAPRPWLSPSWSSNNT